MAEKRNRLAYALVLIVITIAGLLSRSHLAAHIPLFISTYAGDTLWSLALYLTLCILFPDIRLVVVTLLTIAISFLVEFSQLYQAEWLDTIRDTRVGALLLGVRFIWTDLPCYIVGGLMGMCGELLASINKKTIRSDT